MPPEQPPFENEKGLNKILHVDSKRVQRVIANAESNRRLRREQDTQKMSSKELERAADAYTTQQQFKHFDTIDRNREKFLKKISHLNEVITHKAERGELGVTQSIMEKRRDEEVERRASKERERMDQLAAIEER